METSQLLPQEQLLMQESTAWYKQFLTVDAKNPTEARIMLEVLTKTLAAAKGSALETMTPAEQIERLLLFETATPTPVRVYSDNRLVFIGSQLATKAFLLRTAFKKFWSQSPGDDDRETKRQRIVKQIDLIEAWNGKDHLHITGHTVHIPINSSLHSEFGDEY